MSTLRASKSKRQDLAADVGGDENDAANGARKAPVAVGRSLELDVPAELAMENILEKLKLLGYEQNFCKRKRPHFAPLTRTYFTAPPLSNNQNEQFFYFTSLVSWLLGLAGRNFAPPAQFEDPNIACNNILIELKEIGFATPNFPATKLNRGHGEAVCGVLDNILSLALERQGFAYRKPVHQPDNYREDADVDEMPGDNNAVICGEGAGDIIGGVDEDEEEEAYLEGLRDGQLKKTAEEIEESRVLESNVDPAKWKLELERVAPHLKVTITADNKDWRAHLEAAHQHLETITTSFPETKSQLDRVSAEVSEALEKIRARETFVNNEVGHLTVQYRNTREQLLDKQESYNKSTENVAELSNELAHINNLLETVKASTAGHNDNISDTSPLVKIKEAMSQLKGELKNMELQIGVVRHSVLRVYLNSKENLGSLRSGRADEQEEEDDDDLGALLN